MTSVSFVGAGKIGLPMAVSLDAAGHNVLVTDVDDRPRQYLEARKVPYREEGLDELLRSHTVRFGSMAEAARADIAFVTVQTPHQPAYDGTRPPPERTRDFEYGFLVQAVRSLVAAAAGRSTPLVVVVVSTVLPGTFDRVLRPLATSDVQMIYSPCFIAMGTTVHDFAHPEFVLIGADRAQGGVDVLNTVLDRLHQRPRRVVSIASAELTKLAYNVYVSAKIAFANYVGELAEHTGADADEVTDSLALATDRVVSSRYMRAGMGDGGHCHPRDGLALSWLAERTGMSHDLAADLMAAREAHACWLADLTRGWADLTGLPVVVLGKAYKPESDLTAGSPAALAHHLLLARGVHVADWWDPHVDEGGPPQWQAVYFVATRHPEFPALEVPAGSVVVDPFGYMPDREGVTVVRPGRH